MSTLSQFFGCKPLKTTIYTSGSGTYTPIDTNSWVRVTMVGGGGGGGSNGSSTGGGGGGGETISGFPLRLDGGTAYVVGAGGAAAANGSSSVFGLLRAAGGRTPWSSSVSGVAGLGGGMAYTETTAAGKTQFLGRSNYSTSGGPGGVGGVGAPLNQGAWAGGAAGYSIFVTTADNLYRIPEGGGDPGGTFSYTAGGGGGNSLYGKGGKGGSTSVGEDGTGYGGGGGGGSTTKVGGAGSGGMIIIEDFGA